MKHPIWTAGILVLLAGTAAAQTVGQVTSVALPAGSATLNLDFSAHDYELILYSAVTDEPDTTRTYTYTVSGASPVAKPLPSRVLSPPIVTDRDRLEARLRQRERNLAERLKQQGGWHPSLRKTVQSAPDSTRTFAFDKFGGVTSDRTVQATLVASSSRALAYVDNAMSTSGGNLTTAQIQAMMDRFSNDTYPIITSAFGAPSDVDGNGKVIFLFTPLVDQVGGVAGFYSASSLFSIRDGGDGNQADMMFISPTQESGSTTMGEGSNGSLADRTPPNPAQQSDFYTPLLAHEFQHLINFNQHVLVHNGDSEESWLNEALSHVAEDLVGGHVSGGNSDLVDEFLNAPGRYMLTGDAEFSNGIRGAAYMFVRGLMESSGSDILARLDQTAQVGIPNVEAATGQGFSSLYQAFVSRIFLSGTGLNSSLTYSDSLFTDPTTGHRSLPLPLGQVFSPGGASVSGSVRPAAMAFVRLSGNGQGAVQIQTEAAGDFQALLIALPKDFIPPVALPVNYFPGIRLNAPLPGVYTAGQSVEISGTVLDSSITQILFSFKPRTGNGPEITFQFDPAGGQFSHSIVFSPTQAGEYTLTVYGGQQGQSLPALRDFPGAIVTPGSGTVDLPVDYFSGLTLDAPLPTQYTAGTGASISGKTLDSSIEVLLLVFTPQNGGNVIQIQTDVSSGAFRKGYVFTPDQAGTYTLDVYGGPGGSSLPFLGEYTPIVVTSTGTEQVFLPVDIFDNVLFDAPVATAFTVGQAVTVSGRVTDPNISQVDFSFSPASGGADIDRYVSVSGGRFSTQLDFTTDQIGAYELKFYGGVAGQSLPFLGSFSPVQVQSVSSSPTADFNGDGKVDFSDFIAFARAYGTAQGDANYSAKFDLNSDGKVDFSDFIAFARAYGT